MPGAFFLALVQHLKEPLQPFGQVAAIWPGVFHIVRKLPLGKNACIIGKKAKQQPHQIDLKLMALIAVFLEGVV